LVTQAEECDHAGFNRPSNCHLHFASLPLERVDPTCLCKGRIGRNKSMSLAQYFNGKSRLGLVDFNPCAATSEPRLFQRKIPF
jgi:hypothetical protein